MRFISPNEAAEVLPFTARVIRKKLRNGSLPGRKIGSRWQVDMLAIDFMTIKEVGREENERSAPSRSAPKTKTSIPHGSRKT